MKRMWEHPEDEILTLQAVIEVEEAEKTRSTREDADLWNTCPTLATLCQEQHMAPGI